MEFLFNGRLFLFLAIFTYKRNFSFHTGLSVFSLTLVVWMYLAGKFSFTLPRHTRSEPPPLPSPRPLPPPLPPPPLPFSLPPTFRRMLCPNLRSGLGLFSLLVLPARDEDKPPEEGELERCSSSGCASEGAVPDESPPIRLPGIMPSMQYGSEKP